MGYGLRLEIFGKRAWTMTAWKDEVSLAAFVRAPTHREAFRRSGETAWNIRFASLELPLSALPPSWRERRARSDLEAADICADDGAARAAGADHGQNHGRDDGTPRRVGEWLGLTRRGVVRPWIMNLFLPKLLLRLEGAAVLLVSLAAFQAWHGSWGWFAALFLAPDVAALGYLVGLRTGAACYNAVHTYLLPLGVGLICHFTGHTAALPWLAIWAAHIGFDRMANYGLKYPTAFKDTHLGRV